MKNFELYNGDCLDVLKTLSDNSVDSIVTDPPYGLSFMGKKWDYDVPSIEIWEECLRVLRPGGHLLAFAGTRTQHRMAVCIEDAGFEIRDMIAWVYGTGFPKSLNISKAIDKSAEAEREVIGKRQHPTLIDKSKIDRPDSTQFHGSNTIKDEWDLTAPATDAAKQWDGWGTALKPALEPITMARKPLDKKTVAENVLEYGTGGINIDGCRVEFPSDEPICSSSGSKESENICMPGKNYARGPYLGHIKGRFPANFIHDGSEEVIGLFPETKSGKDKNPTKKGVNGFFGKDMGYYSNEANYGDIGNASRFFYCPKASKTDRNEGCYELEEKQSSVLPMRSASGKRGGVGADGTNTDRITVAKNNHPTVKPTELMKYLCRLVTPPNGVVLDPFMGSGSTGKAAKIEGFGFIGIEREKEYFEIAKARIESTSITTHVKNKKTVSVPIIQEENPLDIFFEE